MHPEKPPSPAPLLDLRPHTRRSDRCLTRIYLVTPDHHRYLWVVGGELNLQTVGDAAQSRWILKMYLGHKGLTCVDREHDSAYAFYIELLGVAFDSLHYHQTELRGWIKMYEPDSFHVPKKLDFVPDGQATCDNKDCAEDPDKHYVIDKFTPEPNLSLYKKIQGFQVVVAVDTLDPADPYDLQEEVTRIAATPSW